MIVEQQINTSKIELLEAISELFLRYGLRSTSMDDIAGHLKISKKTLYQHFSNKDEVVGQVILYRRARKKADANWQEMETMNPIAVLSKIKHFLANDLNSRLPANYYDMRKYHPTVYQKLQQEDEEERKQFFTHMLSKGQQDGYIRKDVDVDFQIYLLDRQLHFLGEPEALDHLEYTFAQIISTILDNFILALATDKGRQEFERLHQGG